MKISQTRPVTTGGKRWKRVSVRLADDGAARKSDFNGVVVNANARLNNANTRIPDIGAPLDTAFRPLG
jgi:hypothetical protein